MTNNKPGATGKFPDGKISEDDEGELKIAISSDDNLVRIDFGKEISWLAFPPSDALHFAKLLLQHANQVTWRNKQ